jgi:biopolymer transport protein ExbD/biopolymer transport protein TolR
MAAKVGGSDEYNSDINVTPMVDVMLVLLIIFMIITPLLQDGVQVNIPKNMRTPIEDPDVASDTSVVVSIPKDGQFYIGTQKEPYALDVLGEKIKALMEGKKPEERIVYVKSGIDVNYGTVVEAIDTIRKQDIDKIGLVADKAKDTKEE